MTTRLRLTTSFLGVFALVIALGDAVLAGKPTPPPFAVKYRIQFLTHIPQESVLIRRCTELTWRE